MANPDKPRRKRRSARLHNRLATPADLRALTQQYNTASQADKPSEGAATATDDQPMLPPQAPPFLQGLPDEDTRYAPTQSINQHLQQLIEHASYQDNFERAIRTVADQEILELSDITTLDQFYFYLDRLVEWIPEIRVWNVRGDIVHERTVYSRLVQFYYYFNQPELEALQSPIEPVDGNKLTPLSVWLRDFAVAWGSFLDTGKSARHLESFKYAPEYTWQDYEKPPEHYDTFNEFFGRQFSDINRLRPVAKVDDDRTIVFPAESTFVGQWAITTPVGTPLPAGPSVVVKHIEWSIHELLECSEFAGCFEGGVFCHSFLNTYDYHRLHTPVAGKVVEAKFIAGQVYLEVGLKTQDPDAPPDPNIANTIVPNRYLDADDPTGYQFVQCRGLLVLETPNLGYVAVLPMGMAQVSSVVFTTPGPDHTPITLTDEECAEKSYQQQVDAVNAKISCELVGQQLGKGEMFSLFQFGGSDCVVVFERRANVNITATRGVHYPIRSQYAVANYNKQ